MIQSIHLIPNKNSNTTSWTLAGPELLDDPIPPITKKNLVTHSQKSESPPRPLFFSLQLLLFSPLFLLFFWHSYLTKSRMIASLFHVRIKSLIRDIIWENVFYVASCYSSFWHKFGALQINNKSCWKHIYILLYWTRRKQH